MKKTFLSLMTIGVICSCDPISDMEATIQNLTAQDLIIEFVSFDSDLGRTLVIPMNETKVFEELIGVTGNPFLAPALTAYDSVVVKNNAEQILKVYKPINTGKNIFGIDEYWLLRKPSKRFFQYEYEIYSEDLE